MATRTSITNGSWSASSTWDTGVPVDTDTAIISAAHNVTFDADQSAWTTGLAALTINGTLTVNTSASSSMFIKAAGAIRGTGTFNIGTSASPIPFATKFNLTGGVAWYLKGDDTTGLTTTIYGTEPTNNFVTFSASRVLGNTEMWITENVTTETNYWKTGDTVILCSNTGTTGTQQTTITGVSASAISISGSLLVTKNAGDIIALATRNVKITQVPTGGGFSNYQYGKLSIGSGWINAANNYSAAGCLGILFSGGIITGASMYSCAVTMSGGVYCNSGRAFYAMSNSYPTTLSGGLIVGVGEPITVCYNFYMTGGRVYGCNTNGVGIIGNNSNNAKLLGGILEKGGSNYGVTNSRGLYVNGITFKNNSGAVFNECYDSVVVSGSFINNGYILSRANQVKFYNTTAIGTTGYNTQYLTYMLPNVITEMINNTAVSGSYKAWTAGGTITSQSAVVPVGYSQSNLQTLESALQYNFYPVDFTVPAGDTTTIGVNLRKSTSMTYLPRIYLAYRNYQPMIENSAIDSFTMTNSNDTWETDTFTINNTAITKDTDYTLWFVARNATGSVYSAHTITSSSGSGTTTSGGVSRSRVYGGL